MILSHLLFTQPFVVIVVYARMLSFDWRVVESARDLGASPLRAFVTVTLPIIQPTVIGAALIAVALSIDDFVITFFTIGGGNTLPTFVWGMIRHRAPSDRQRDRHAHHPHNPGIDAARSLADPLSGVAASGLPPPSAPERCLGGSAIRARQPSF